MRRPVTDIALLSFIAKKNADVISYTDATQACKSSSSASRALHQLIKEGLMEPEPKLVGLRYVTQYAVTSKGKQASRLALQLTELREKAAQIKQEEMSSESEGGNADVEINEPTQAAPTKDLVSSKRKSPALKDSEPSKRQDRRQSQPKKNTNASPISSSSKRKAVAS
jgi:hypothetical protein